MASKVPLLLEQPRPEFCRVCFERWVTMCNAIVVGLPVRPSLRWPHPIGSFPSLTRRIHRRASIPPPRPAQITPPRRPTVGSRSVATITASPLPSAVMTAHSSTNGSARNAWIGGAGPAGFDLRSECGSHQTSSLLASIMGEALLTRMGHYQRRHHDGAIAGHVPGCSELYP